MNFTINQTNGIRETVNSEFINKLYNLFITNRSSHTISLSGYLYSPTGYKALMDALNSLYGPDLVIEVPAAGLYILIEDPAVLLILLDNNVSSDGIGISVADAADANLTASMFRNNTTITSFNEFPYFTKANTNPPSLLFNGCKNLTQINLSNVIRTAEYEFSSSGIRSINAPSLTELGLLSFAFTEIETIEDLGSITTIPDYCFRECKKLVSAVIPTTVTAIGIYAFSAYNGGYTPVFTTITGINNVTNFGNMCFCTLYNLNLDTSNLSPDITVIGNSAFSEVHTSGILHLKKLTSLGNYAFYNSKLTKITCLGKVTKIGDHAFLANESYSLKNSLTEVYLPYECNTLGDRSFWNRTGLTTIKLYTDSVDNWVEGETPTYTDISRVTSFGDSCFYNCTSLLLTPADITGAITIGRTAFYNTLFTATAADPLNLTNVSTIEREAFRETHISSVIWSSSVFKIPLGCFLKCGLEYISNLDHVTELSGRCFQGCNLKHVLYLKNVTHTNYYGDLWSSSDAGHTFIGDYMNGSAYALYMPKTIDVFGGYYINSSYSSGFFGDRGRATIPVVYFKELQEIYPASFSNLTCTSLIINNSIPPVWYNANKKADADVDPQETKDKAFVASNITNLYVPDGAISTYENDPNWATLILSGVNILGMSNLTHYATEADWNTAGRPANGIIDAYM